MFSFKISSGNFEEIECLPTVYRIKFPVSSNYYGWEVYLPVIIAEREGEFLHITRDHNNNFNFVLNKVGEAQKRRREEKRLLFNELAKELEEFWRPYACEDERAFAVRVRKKFKSWKNLEFYVGYISRKWFYTNKNENQYEKYFTKTHDFKILKRNLSENDFIIIGNLINDLESLKKELTVSQNFSSNSNVAIDELTKKLTFEKSKKYFLSQKKKNDTLYERFVSDKEKEAEDIFKMLKIEAFFLKEQPKKSE